MNDFNNHSDRLNTEHQSLHNMLVFAWPGNDTILYMPQIDTVPWYIYMIYTCGQVYVSPVVVL